MISISFKHLLLVFLSVLFGSAKNQFPSFKPLFLGCFQLLFFGQSPLFIPFLLLHHWFRNQRFCFPFAHPSHNKVSINHMRVCNRKSMQLQTKSRYFDHWFRIHHSSLLTTPTMDKKESTSLDVTLLATRRKGHKTEIFSCFIYNIGFSLLGAVFNLVGFFSVLNHWAAILLDSQLLLSPH